MQTISLLETLLVTALVLGANVAQAHTPGAPAAVVSSQASATCIPVPAGFSQPAVLGKTPPESFWKGWRYGDHVTLAATPTVALVDRSVSIRVGGLKPGEPVTLRTSMTGYQKHPWTAQATFVADAHGEVNVAEQAPKYGSYSGVHAMGLVWSMQPQQVKHPGATFYEPSGTSFPIEMEAVADGRVLVKTTFTRNFMAPGVTKTEVHQDGLVGELFEPATSGTHPAVIVLGGSEGGLYPQVNEAALLASHGYVALGLAYFQGFVGGRDPRLTSLPKSLVNIPLEYFVKAAEWLQKQPGVDPHRLAIMGWSKGAEAALVAASEFPKAFQAVVAFMPSSMVWPGIDFQGSASSSWTLRGKPLPWLDFAKMDPAMFASGKPVAFVHAYRPALDNADAADKAAIPVERIGGPVLLISAGDDQVWPSSLMARQIERRRAAHQRSSGDESLCYAGAGHGILPPWRPTNATAAGTVAFGGNAVAYAFADRDAWNHVLAFLRISLDGGKPMPPTAPGTGSARTHR